MKKAKLFLYWLAMGTLPVWAQTGVSPYSVAKDQTAAALRDVATTASIAGTGATKTNADGLYKFSLLAPNDLPLKFTATQRAWTRDHEQL